MAYQTSIVSEHPRDSLLIHGLGKWGAMMSLYHGVPDVW